MSGTAFAAALLLTLAWVALGAAVVLSLRAIRPLSEPLAGVAPGAAPPALSVVITARDEADRVEAAVRRVLAQRYPGLRCIAVDDRSTDGTGAILDRLAAGAAGSAGRLVVARVTALPDGWIGKCNACRVGADRARGDWILFMDGDVELLEDDLLARVVALAERLRLDHVALIPDQRPLSAPHAALLAVFAQMYLTATLAFEMERDRPRGGGGIGAFNLVRRTAYDRVGGHARLRFDLADDFKLGRLLKESGARQRFYSAGGLVRCPWHAGALRVVGGLEKNLFAGFDFSLAEVAGFTVLALGMTCGPAALLLLRGAWLPLAAQAAALAAFALLQAPELGVAAATLWLLQPAGTLLLLLALWNSTVRTLRRGGVIWRGTFYRLADLRRGSVRPGAGRRPAPPSGPLTGSGPPPPGSALP